MRFSIQVPLVISKPVPIPHPVPLPHPITLTKPIFIPVPKAIPIPQSSYDNGDYAAGDDGSENVAHETANYSSYSANVQAHGVYDQQNGDQAQFQPSQPDYSAEH